MLSVVTPAQGRDILTDVDIQELLGINDPILSARIARQVTSLIEGYCKRPFGLATYRQVERLQCALDQIILERWPVVEIVSVAVDGGALVGADYEADIDRGMLYRMISGAPCGWRGRRVEVVYKAGYLLAGGTASNLPGNVQRAAEQLAASIHASQGRDPLLRTQATDEVGSTSWLDPRPGMEALPPQVAGALDSYLENRAG